MSENVDGSLTEEQVQNPAEDESVSGTESEPVEAVEAETESEPVKHEEPKTPWFQKRIDELTREKWEARREAEAHRVLAESLRNRQPGEEVKHDTSVDVEALATQKAKELFENQSFNEACNSTYTKGKEAFADFDTAVKSHQMLGEMGSRKDYLEAINSLPNGPQVYHHLAKNLDNAASVLSLSPVKMALELTKISEKLSKPAPVSKAPAPIKPIGGGGSHESDPSKMSTAEWIKWRDKQVAEESKR